ncbi:MAG: MotA/TolQ/ExbB proton channel family protein [Planctomycetaceae bacterium]
MPSGAHGTSRLAYPGTLAMLTLALAFPIALMIFDPTLMFERGWEQYVGTAIYFWAVLTLGRELARLWADERAFADAPAMLKQVAAGSARARSNPGAPGRPGVDDDRRILPTRVRQLARYVEETSAPSVGQLMELNREGSALDQEHAAGRFTLTRYILYLLPVIGFIGTVEGISKALMEISKVLPLVKDLDGFMGNLTKVTSALQIAFDSTLLALFLSAALMLVQTLVYRRSEDLLARVDRWIVENILPRFGTEGPVAAGIVGAIGPLFEALRDDLAAVLEPAARTMEQQATRLGASLGAPVERFAQSVERLPAALSGFQRGAEAIGRIGTDLESIGAAGETLRRGVATLGRIETAVTRDDPVTQQFAEIKKGIDRTCAAIEGMSQSWALAYERSSRATQEQLAQTLSSLKDALELINVSMEQSNALYRNIVKWKFQVYREEAS